MSKPFAEQIVDELQTFFQPFTDTGGNAVAILKLLSGTGWPLDRIVGVNQARLVTAVQGIITKVNGLAAIAVNPPTETLLLLAKLGEALAPLFADVMALTNSLPNGLPADV